MTIAGPRGAAYLFGRVGGVRLGRGLTDEHAEELLLVAPERGCSVTFVASGMNDQVLGVLVLRVAEEPTTPVAHLLCTSRVGEAAALEALGALLSELGPVSVGHEIGARFGVGPEVVGDVPAEHTARPWPGWGGARVEWDGTLGEEWQIYRVIGERLPILWCPQQFASWLEERS